VDGLGRARRRERELELSLHGGRDAESTAGLERELGVLDAERPGLVELGVGETASELRSKPRDRESGGIADLATAERVREELDGESGLRAELETLRRIDARGVHELIEPID
jgi:hypothetical protein